MDRTRDELYRTRDLIDHAQNDIRRILAGQIEDTQRAALLEQSRALLGSYQQNEDVDSLRTLGAESAAILWQMRRSMAESLYYYRRYIDLRLGRADAIQRMAHPGSLTQAFSYVHLLSLLGRIQETTVYNTLPEVTSWDTTFSAAESRQPFERLCRRERANFTVTGVPDFLSPSRLRSLTVQVLDAAGHPVRGYFRLSQDRGLAFALSGGAKYDLDGASWLFRTDVSGR
jgi:hypothetical protein